MPPAPRRRGRRLLGLAVFLLLWGRYTPKAWPGNDFRVYHTAARAALAGGDPYAARTPDGRRYLYPPTLAALLFPLAVLPHRPAAAIWIALETGALAAMGFLLLRACGGAAALLALLCVARPVDSDLGNGQVNLLVAALLAAGALALHRGRPLGGGAFLGAAASLKATPVLFLVWLAWRRQGRALGAAAATALGLLLLLPALLWGPARAGAANAAWAARFLAPLVDPSRPSPPGLGGGRPDYVPGHSLRALLHRRLRRSSAEGSPRRPPRYVQLAELPPQRVERIYRGAALLVVLLTLGLGCRGRPRWLLEAGLLVAAMLLAAPVTRKAHLVALALPAAVVARRARRNRALWYVLGAAALLLDGTAPGLLGRRVAELALAHGALTAALGLLWGTLLLLAVRRPPAGSRSAPPCPPPAGSVS